MKQIKAGNITDNETTLKDTIKRRYLESFNRQHQERKPRHPLQTCDLHLTGKQELKYITPTHEPVDEITWNEPQDVRELWENQAKKFWLSISVISFIFILIIFYMGAY